MKDYKYWVNGYDEVLGEFSIGFKDFGKAKVNYENTLQQTRGTRVQRACRRSYRYKKLYRQKNYQKDRSYRLTNKNKVI